MLYVNKETHLDHELTMEQLRWILNHPELDRPVLLSGDGPSVLIKTLTMPEELGTLPCGLYGPLMGDDPIYEEEVYYRPRGKREWDSRLLKRANGMLPHRPVRQVSQVSVIAGPYNGMMDLLYTVYGGPVAPREPGDPSLLDSEAALAQSKDFWRGHALVAPKE